MSGLRLLNIKLTILKSYCSLLVFHQQQHGRRQGTLHYRRGGGVAGSVIASRLHEKNPSLSIVLIEAGSDVTEHPWVLPAATAPRLLGSEMDWKYSTVPQRHFDQRVCSQHAGKALGGGSAINAGEYHFYK